MPHGAMKPEIMHEEQYNEADRRDHSFPQAKVQKNHGSYDIMKLNMKVLNVSETEVEIRRV